MSILNNSLLLGAPAAATGYTISRSLRFNSADSAYLSRTPGSAGNRKTWTWAGWVKRSTTSSFEEIFSVTRGASTRPNLDFYFDSSGFFTVEQFNGSSYDCRLITNAVYRDTSAWYHFVVTIDTTQATAANRAKVYVNGSEVTFSTATYPSQNADLEINNTSAHNIGRFAFNGTGYFNGYLADIHFIDGQALTPTSFGEFDATTGVWVPKAYTGTYGTNGFRLDFSDNSAATATTLGKDRAGSNNWTPNNLSVTAGAGNDSLVDVPVNGSQTDTGAGGEVRGNYATLNPLSKQANCTLNNGNLDWASTSTGSVIAQSTIAMSSGKWYCEFTATGGSNMFGLQRTAGTVATSYVGGNADSWGYYGDNGNKYTNGSATAYGASFGANDVIGIAFDADNGTLTFYKNGASQGQAYSGLTSGPYTFAIGNGSAISGIPNATANFGQRPFAYTAPSGFKALCTANLPAPLVTKSSTVFDVALYTGNGGTQTISGLGFSPDLVWLKARSLATTNILFDSVRGNGNYLSSDQTGAENFAGNLGWSSSGPSGNGIYIEYGSNGSINNNATTYAAWAWDAGSTTVTNTQGSITSSVRANATAGFSIVTWTGNGASATVGHGLNVAPSMLIVKSRTTGNSWVIYHRSLGGGSFLLFDTSAAGASGNATWGSSNSDPTSTVFSVGSGAATNSNGASLVAYCFAPVAGYSSFGSYTGNGSADGPFVYTGFRPRWILIKNPSMASDWVIFDSARSPVNALNDYLAPNSSSAEGVDYTPSDIDFLSNGFKLRGTWSGQNGSAVSIIFAAFAESPFQYARAR